MQDGGDCFLRYFRSVPSYFLMNAAEFQSTARHLLFIDIETVSGESSLELVSERLQKEWLRKADRLRSTEGPSDAELYFDRAAVYAEFGKIIVIGLGFFHWEADEPTFRVRTIHGHDEASVLRQFCTLVEKRYARKLILCAHNGREFDYPYLCRRMMIHGIPIPRSLWNTHWRRYDSPHLDTMDYWKFGDFKNYTSLELLAALFGIPSSKDTLSGSEVNTTYYHKNNLISIAQYCREDVVVLAQLYLRYHQMELLQEKQIIRLDS